MCRAGFSPRKAALTLYAMGEALADSPGADALFAALGKHERGKGCLYIRRLADVDQAVLAQLIALSWAGMHRRYPEDQPPAL